MAQKGQKTKIGASKGATMVEITVALAVIAIVMTMIVSFTVLINKHQAKTNEEFLFLEKCSNLKKDILEWFTFVDGDTTQYTVKKGGLIANFGGVTSSVAYLDGVLTIGEDNINTDGIDSILFYSNDQMIKCTIYATIGDKQKQTSFVFSPRCGQVVSTQSQQGGFDA